MNPFADEIESLNEEELSNYIKEAPEELEGTSRMTGTKLSVLNLNKGGKQEMTFNQTKNRT